MSYNPKLATILLGNTNNTLLEQAFSYFSLCILLYEFTMVSSTRRKKPQMWGFKIHGGRRGIRTLDTRIFSPLLYQLSYPTSMYAQMSSDASRYSTHYPFFGQAFCSTCTVNAIKSERIGAFAHKPPVRYVLFAHTILCSNRRILLGFFQNEGVCDKSFAVDPLRMRSR